MADRFQAYVRKPDVLHSTVTDTVLALSVDAGQFFSFTGPSARLWELLELPITAEQAARRLTEEYVVDEDACREQVDVHFRNLHAEGLVTVVDPGA